MGVFGAGGRVTIRPGARVPTNTGLLSVADLVPPDEQLGERWLNGITYLAERCDSGFGAAYLQCALDAQARALEDDKPVARSADPFAVWAGDICSSFGWTEHDFVQRAQRWLALTEERSVEAEFWDGAQAKAGNSAFAGSYDQTQYLTDDTTDTVLNSGTAIDAVGAIALLTQYLADTAGVGRGLIHLTPKSAVYAAAAGAIRRESGQWLDVVGNRVVIGQGYSGNGPGGSTPSGGHWAYATGTVRYWRDEPLVLPGSYAQAIDKTTNTIRFWASRNYLVDYDRCAHGAVLLKHTPLDLEA